MRRWIYLWITFFFSYPTLADSFLLFEEQGKVGIRDEAGKIWIPASFEALGWSNGSFSVIGQITGYKLKNKWGILNLQKQFITPADFESLTYPGGDRIIASRKLNPFTVKFGCLDFNGKVAIPFNYDGVAIAGLRAVVFVKNGAQFEYGLVDLNDKGILPLRYSRISPIGTLRYEVENKSHKSALFSDTGTQLTDFTIDSISSFHSGLAVIYQNFSQGIIDREGEIRVPSTFREIKVNEDGSVWAREFDQWKIIDEGNHELKTVSADRLESSGNETFLVTLEGKCGLLDKDLRIVLPLQYDYISPEDHGNRVVGVKGRYGLMRANHSLILPIQFDSILFEGLFARVAQRSNGFRSWVLYDTFGIQKSAGSFDFIGAYDGSLFPVNKRGYWGAINRYGEEFINCVFDSLIEVKNNLLVVKFRGQFGIINKEDKWILPPQSNPISLVNDEYYLEFGDSVTFLKSFRKETIYFTSHTLTVDGDHLKETLPDGIETAISFQGLLITPPPEHLVLGEGLTRIRKDGKFGFVDKRGRLRIANRYDEARNFQEDRAPVKLIGKWGFIDSHDNIAVNPNYDAVDSFVEGLAIVRKGGKVGLINKEGKVLLPIRYDTLHRLPDHSYLIGYSGNLVQYGMADKNGNILIEPRFESITNLENGLVIAGREGKFGLVTKDGLSTVPMIYDSMAYDKKNNSYIVVRRSPWKKLTLN